MMAEHQSAATMFKRSTSQIEDSSHNASFSYRGTLPPTDADAKPGRLQLVGDEVRLSRFFEPSEMTIDHTPRPEFDLFGCPTRGRRGTVRVWTNCRRVEDGSITLTIRSGKFELHRLRSNISHATLESDLEDKTLCAKDTPQEGWTTLHGSLKVSRVHIRMICVSREEGADTFIC